MSRGPRDSVTAVPGEKTERVCSKWLLPTYSTLLRSNLADTFFSPSFFSARTAASATSLKVLVIEDRYTLFSILPFSPFLTTSVAKRQSSGQNRFRLASTAILFSPCHTSIRPWRLELYLSTAASLHLERPDLTYRPRNLEEPFSVFETLEGYLDASGMKHLIHGRGPRLS